MHWWFLLGSAFFILGGLLSVQPTRTQRRIAALRETARDKGLHVKLPVSLSFPEGVTKSSCPYYCKNLNNRRLSREFAHVRRLDGENIEKSQVGNLELEKKLESRLASMPNECSALYLGAGLLAASWNEAEENEPPEWLVRCLSEMESEFCDQ